MGLGAESELTTILEGIGEGFYAVDHDWRITRFNGEAQRHFGIAPTQILGRRLWDVFPRAQETGLGQLFLQTMKTRSTVRAETESVIFAGKWLAYRLFPLGDGMGIVFRDVTDRKRVEQQRELLINELNHRVKNTLATVQSMAAQTFRNGAVEPGLLDRFDRRLVALASVHGLLTDENWKSAELHDVIRASLRHHFAPERVPFTVVGPALKLRPKTAVSISMAVHELGTNAIKYGALSTDAGRVSIVWTVDSQRFLWRWEESGGPAVTAPTRKGFGSRLIERGLSAELGGDVRIDYRPQGVICTIDAPIDSVRERGGEA